MTATALYQWFFHEQDVPEEVRKDSLLRTWTHAILIVFPLWFLAFFVPGSIEIIFSGTSGHMPRVVQILIEHSNFLRMWFLVIVVVIVLGLRCDHLVYTGLHKKSVRSKAQQYANAVTVALSVVNGFYLFCWLMFVRLCLEHNLVTLRWFDA
ncbi:MAG: hypothetical protein ACO1QS_15740 [Verrucomicrobiota bacterium]